MATYGYKSEWEKQYKEKNGDSYSNIWRKENHEEFRKVRNAYQSQKINCECGCEIRRNHQSRHRQSKKHIEKVFPPKNLILIKKELI